MSRRPYFFEIFTLTNFVVLEIAMRRVGLSAFRLLDKSFLVFGPFLLLQVLVGIGVRGFVAWRRGEGDYLKLVRTPRFLSDVVRIIIVSVLFAHIYGWIKVAVPAWNPRLYDQLFWDLDRALFFGFSPNIFFLNLFAHPLALHAVDWSYASVFALAIFIGGAFFIPHPDPGVRTRFVNANVALWIIGAWLYVAFPALDPCYRFPSVWVPLSAYLQQTQTFQRLLMQNYLNFHQFVAGRPAPVNLLFGLSAFPSLHVAYAFLVFLFMRRAAPRARILFAVFTLIILIGSLVTGWHYLVDAIAGIALAALCYWTFAIRLAPKTF